MRAVLRWLLGGKAQRSEGKSATYIASTKEMAEQPLQALVPTEKVLEEVPPASNSLEVFIYKRKLRELDAEIAVEFWFFSSAEFSSRWDLSPKGLLRAGDDYDEAHSRTDRRQPVMIPHYSSHAEDFLLLEGRVKSWHADLYLLSLSSQELNESIATLEQKCRAALQARRSATTMGRRA